MPDYLLLMHDDATEATQGWDTYLQHLREAEGCFYASATWEGCRSRLSL
jgi:hypothetical protein